MKETVIVSAARTPFGRFGGVLQTLKAVDLGGIAIGEAVKRAGIQPDQVEYAYMGQVLQGGCGQVPSRQATRKAGLPWETPSHQRSISGYENPCYRHEYNSSWRYGKHEQCPLFASRYALGVTYDGSEGH